MIMNLFLNVTGNVEENAQDTFLSPLSRRAAAIAPRIVDVDAASLEPLT